MIYFGSISAFFVSQSEEANDTSSGLSPEFSKDGNGPLRTLEDTLEKITELRRIGVYQPITIKLIGSEYALEKTLVINENVYGVTIEPFCNQPFLLSGGKRITGFKELVFNDQRCFAAYIPEVESGEWQL